MAKKRTPKAKSKARRPASNSFVTAWPTRAIAAIIGLGAALAAHPVMAQEVFAGSKWNSVRLGSTGTGPSGVRLLLPSRVYLVNAKVSVHNLDSDPQPAVCRLMVESPFPGNPRGVFALDRAEVRIDHRDGGDMQVVTLLGVATLSGSTTPAGGKGQIALTCVSPNATASDWVITATKATGTVNVPPCTDALFCSQYTFPPP
jgi:hypothetical protein